MTPEQITLTAYTPCNRVAMRTISAAAPLIPKATRMAHRLRLFVVPAPTVTDNRGGFGWGAFRICRGLPQIWIAGQKHSRLIGDKSHAQHLIETLSHELAHYEQWRDELRLQERGIAPRAKRIAAALAVALAPAADASIAARGFAAIA